MRRAAFVALTISFMAITTAYAADYDAWFPAPLKNWTASKISYNQSKVDRLTGEPPKDSSKSDPMGLFTITRYQVSREYYAPDKKGGVAIIFDNYDCAGTAMIEMMHKDAKARRQMGDRLKPVKVEGFYALEGYNKKKQKDLVMIWVRIW